MCVRRSRHDWDMDETRQQARRAEADLLAEIGRHLFGQDLRVSVRLPRSLADGASAAWSREDTDDTGAETDFGRTIRRQAGDLALIGLAEEERGSTTADGDVAVELHAWQIGAALDAAEERGLLKDAQPPQSDE